jgi:hypothetical protein
MAEDDSVRAEARRAERANWPVRVYSLGDEPLVDELDTRTVNELVRDTLELSRQAFVLSGQPWPTYTRATMPGRLFRR